MFRVMKRIDKQLSMEESKVILTKGEYGVLSTISSNGYPYTIPLNYVYFKNDIYIHSAIEGQKLDNIAECDKVAFCVVCDVELLPKRFDTNFRSVVIFGRAREVFENEKDEALLALIKKYSNQFIEQGKKYIQNKKDETKVIKIDIEHITGKAHQ